MTSIFEGQPPKTRSFPIKTRVLCRYHPWHTFPPPPLHLWHLSHAAGHYETGRVVFQEPRPDARDSRLTLGPGESSRRVGFRWFRWFGGANSRNFWGDEKDSYTYYIWHFLTSNSPKSAQLWRKNPLSSHVMMCTSLECSIYISWRWLVSLWKKLQCPSRTLC